MSLHGGYRLNHKVQVGSLLLLLLSLSLSRFAFDLCPLALLSFHEGEAEESIQSGYIRSLLSGSEMRSTRV